MAMEPFRELCRLTGEAVVKYRMIGDGDRILVGLSGGKDSFALLHVLHALRRRAPVRFDVIAATFDPGFPQFNVDGIAAYCRKMNWSHRVVALPMAEILREKAAEKRAGTVMPCVLCSRLRRGKLYGLAVEEGCSRLALGQHFDDIAASFLMSFCRGQGLGTMGPNVPVQTRGKALHVIRPLAFVPESLIVACRDGWELPSAGMCPYEETLKTGDRERFRELIERLGKEIPNLRSQMLHSLSKIRAEHLFDPEYLSLE